MIQAMDVLTQDAASDPEHSKFSDQVAKIKAGCAVESFQ
jgi:hypothetical protein